MLSGCVPPVQELIGGFLQGERYLMGHLAKDSKVHLKRLNISAVPGANNNSAIKVDLILMADPVMIAELLKMPAREYFKKREQIAKDHISSVQIMSWEIVPGQSFEDIQVEYTKRRRPVAAFMYALYHSPGDHRLRIGGGEAVHIVLEEDDWHALPVLDEEE